jgi:nitroreductase
MDVFEAIQNRAMVREYSAKPLTEKDREMILKAGIRAPNASGNEQWYFVVVETPEKQEELYRRLIDAQKFYYKKMLKKPLSAEKIQRWVSSAERGAFKAPFYVAIFSDLRERFCTIPEIEELWAHQSVAAAIENMLLAAWEMGIGGCWFGVPLLEEDKFYRLLGIENDDLKLAAVIGFGYPAGETKPREREKKLENIVRSI